MALFSQVAIRIANLLRRLSFNGVIKSFLLNSWEDTLFVGEALLEFISESVINGLNRNYNLERSLNFQSLKLLS
jgi:hypothetical protein